MTPRTEDADHDREDPDIVVLPPAVADTHILHDVTPSPSSSANDSARDHEDLEEVISERDSLI